MYVEGDVPYNCNGGNNGFGNGWEGLIGLALVASLFGGGWGGFGFGGNNRGGNSCGCCNCATQADLAAGFSSNTIQRGIDDILIGQANMQNWINQGFAGVNLSVERGLAQTNYNIATGLCNLGYQTQQGFTGLGSKIDMCCCNIERAIDGVNFNNANNTCQIIQAINCGNQKLLDYMQNEKIDSLNRKLTVAEGQISQLAQTSTIINALRQPCPIPAYTVPNPNCCYNQCGCTGTNFGGFSVQ